MDYIGLLDCNNFFVSCERLFRPDLLGKPVVVLSGNDGCVVARSNEVKALGVPMGIPYFQVQKELSSAKAVVFSSNFTLYRDISRRVMAVAAQEVGQVEQYSVDEAFFQLTIPDGEEDRVLKRLQALKHAIETQVGVPVSVGLARSKTIAKYAAEKEKRDSGVCFLTGAKWQAEARNLELHQIWGIGAKTSQKMRTHNLLTVADLIAADPARVSQLFGIAGVRKRAELREQVMYPFGTETAAQKSSMSTRSFKTSTTNKSIVLEALLYHTAQVAHELRTKNRTTQYVSIVARPSRHGDWLLRGGSREMILGIPTNDTRELITAVKQLWDELYEPGVPYKKAGVVVGMFGEVSHTQASLFDDKKEPGGQAVLMTVVDELNDRFGNETLTLGRIRTNEAWQSKRSSLSPHYTTQWTDIKTIKTH